jgi:hypothetical protein
MPRRPLAIRSVRLNKRLSWYRGRASEPGCAAARGALACSLVYQPQDLPFRCPLCIPRGVTALPAHGWSAGARGLQIVGVTLWSAPPQSAGMVSCAHSRPRCDACAARVPPRTPRAKSPVGPGGQPGPPTDHINAVSRPALWLRIRLMTRARGSTRTHGEGGRPGGGGCAFRVVASGERALQCAPNRIRFIWSASPLTTARSGTRARPAVLPFLCLFISEIQKVAGHDKHAVLQESQCGMGEKSIDGAVCRVHPT